MLEPVSKEDAKRLGLKRYFTGHPCRKGHVAQRLVSNGSCLDCFCERGRKYRAADPTASRKAVAKWQKANPDWAKNWVKANPDKRKAITKRHYARHREFYRKQHRERYECEGERIREKSRLWKRNNPERNKVQCAIYRARKLSAPGSYTVDDVETIAKAQRNRCALCRRRLTRLLRRVDHIQPLARGGSNHRANLQLLCQPCNSRKNAKDPLEFARENGLLL